jgi:nucleolar protein 58
MVNNRSDNNKIIPTQLEDTAREDNDVVRSSGIKVGWEEATINLLDQVISISEYRAQLSEYLRNPTIAIAPNLLPLSANSSAHG